jgi:hypothetical protein
MARILIQGSGFVKLLPFSMSGVWQVCVHFLASMIPGSGQAQMRCKSLFKILRRAAKFENVYIIDFDFDFTTLDDI